MFALKLGLLFFWACWFGVVFLTNLFDAMKAAGRLPETWKFASKNYEAVVKALSIHEPPRWLAPLLFGGVLLWQLTACVLFGMAFLASWSHGAIEWPIASLALFAGAGLFAAFMLADEITIKYGLEQPHELLLLLQLATALVLVA